MEWHPVACIFPMLSDDELQRLASDIGQFGQREPIVLFEGKVLDGRNRWLACQFADIEPTTIEFSGTPAEAINFVWSTNFYRRHLNPGQAAAAVVKRERFDAEFAAAVEAIKAAAPKNNNAKKYGNSPVQIFEPVKDNSKLTDHKIAEAAGTNRTYVAAARKLLDDRPDLFEQVQRGELKLDKASKQVKQAKKTAMDQASAEKAKEVIAKTDPLCVFHGDSFDLASSIPDESCALIFTDPPYDRKSLHLFQDLGMLASKILVDGGSLITFCGQYVMRDVIDFVAPEFDFDDIDNGKSDRWTEREWMCDAEPGEEADERVWNDMHLFWVNCCLHTGDTAQMREYGIKVKWKPMLWFVKGSFRRDRTTWVDDLVRSNQEKDCHPWQQSVLEASYYIEKLTKPGELVVDPFCGGGTTAVAAKTLGRLWWTADVEATHVKTARERLLQV